MCNEDGTISLNTPHLVLGVKQDAHGEGEIGLRPTRLRRSCEEAVVGRASSVERGKKAQESELGLCRVIRCVAPEDKLLAPSRAIAGYALSVESHMDDDSYEAKDFAPASAAAVFSEHAHTVSWAGAGVIHRQRARSPRTSCSAGAFAMTRAAGAIPGILNATSAVSTASPLAAIWPRAEVHPKDFYDRAGVPRGQPLRARWRSR